MSRAEELLSSYLNLDKLILMDVRSSRPSSHESRATISLKTYKENISAQKVYEKLGFKIIGETEHKKQYKMEIIL